MDKRTAFFVLAIFAVGCVSQDAWSTIAVLDCKGGLHFTPSMALTASYVDLSPIFDDLGQWYVDRVYSAIKCECPNLSTNDFKKHFLIPSVDWLLNTAMGRDGDYSVQNCNAPVFQEFIEDNRNDDVKINFPSTCSYTSWAAGSPCALTFNMPSVDLHLNLMLDHCPNSWFPFVSVTCSGVACDYLAKPCNDNTDCAGGTTCKTLMKENRTTICETFGKETYCHEESVGDIPLVQSVNDLFEALKDLELYDNGDTSPGCLAADTVFTRIFQHIRKSFDNLAQTVDHNIKLCLYDAIINVDEDGGFFDLLDEQLDQNCITENITTPHGIEEHEYCVVTPGFFSTWNGQLPGGAAANSADRKNGVGMTPAITPVQTISEDATAWFHHSCDGQVSFLPEHAHFATALRVPFHTSVDQLMTIIQDIQTCRATHRSSALSTEAFRDRFGPWIQFFLYQLTEPVPIVNIGPAMSDWGFEDIDKKLHMPDKCNYGYWLANGECSVQYNGFSTLFDTNINLRLLVKKCPETAGQPVPVLPEIYLECAGSGCAAIEKPHACTTSGDCTGGTKCHIGEINEFIDTWEDDPIGWAYSRDNTSTCYNNWHNRMKKDARSLFRLLMDQPDDGLTTNDYCFLDIDMLTDEHLENWADSQVTTDINTVTINQLISWNVGVDGNPPSSSSTIVVSFISLVLLLVAMF